MAHGAHAAFEVADRVDPAECGGDHVAVFESGHEAVAFFWIVAKPMQKLGEAPLVGVDAAAPFNAFEAEGMRLGGDLFRFSKCAMIAPQVILVERLEVFTDGNHAGAGRIECDGLHAIAADACCL